MEESKNWNVNYWKQTRNRDKEKMLVVLADDTIFVAIKFTGFKILN